MGVGKFWQDLKISEAFLMSLKVSFLHGLFLLFLSLETFYQRVSWILPFTTPISDHIHFAEMPKIVQFLKQEIK